MKLLISCDFSPAGKYVLQEAKKILTSFPNPEIHGYTVIDLALISSTGLYNNAEVIQSLNEQAEEINKWAQKNFEGDNLHFFQKLGIPKK